MCIRRGIHLHIYCIYMYIFGHKKYLLRYILCTIVRYIYKWSFQICEWYRVYCTHTWYTWDTTTQGNNIHINKSHGGLYWYRYLVIGRFVNEIKLAYPVSSAVCVMDHCAINIITINLKYDRWTNTPFKFK